MIPLATGALVAAVWQGIVLAILVALGLWLLPKTPAAVRFAIWFVVFAVVTVLPAISLWTHASAGAGSGGHAWLTLNERWSLAIAAVWLTASLVRAVTLGLAALRVRALWKRATPVEIGPQGLKPIAKANVHGTSEGVPLSTADLPGGWGNRRRALICSSDEVDRPTVIGFFAPKILIPAWLLAKLTSAELEQVVLHESGHLGRADDWMNLLQKIALVIFPLNPALAWVERRLCFERELAVDERVLHAFSGKEDAATAYASCLTTLAEYRLERRLPHGLALVLGALGRESELGRRVMSILRRGESMKPLHAKLVFGGAVAALLVGAAGFERCPQVVGFAPPQKAVVASLVETPHVPFDAKNVGLRNGMLVPHEVLLKATNEPPTLAPTLSQAETASGVQAAAATVAAHVGNPAARESQAGMRSQMAKAHSPELAGQWVVVTAYRGEDGAHIVMTTSQPSHEDVRAARTVQHTDFSDPGGQASDEAGSQTAPSDVVPAYAAVPVRGGWLIFQL